MVDEKRKTTVPIPPVGADGEQPILNTTTGIITGDEGEINSPGEIFQENPAKFSRKTFWNFKGSMTGSTIPPTSIP